MSRSPVDPPASRLSARDRRFLERAVALGRRGWGRVHPNPMVGAVVARDGEAIAEAHHEEFGGPHAEILALERAGDARGATMYVSLEPCAHAGKTPPCAPALLDAGVARVVYWAPDPGEASGGGGDWLRARGVAVDGPVGEARAWVRENPAFHHAAADPGRPWVALKLAASLDGRIAPPGGRRVWLTGSEARREAHRLRAGFDAILVGGRTWEADDPTLTVRLGDVRPRRQPTPVLLDRRGRAPAGLRALDRPDDGDRRPIVVTTAGRAAAARARLGARADVAVAERGEGGLDLERVLVLLARRGVGSVLCEGGGRVAASLIEGGLVDRIHLFLAPVVVGAGGVPAFPLKRSAAGASSAPFAPSFGRWRSAARPTALGDDALIVLDRARSADGGGRV